MSSVLTDPLAVTGDEQRRLVEQVLRPRVMGALLQEALGTPNFRSECRILDAKYEPGEYCTVLYQLGERMVIGTVTWGESDEDMPQTDRVIEPLGMRVYSSEHDPALPGLDVVRDPRALASALNQALPECRGGAARVLRCRATVLRYRPGRRCTFRVDAWLRDARSAVPGKWTLFGKLYHKLEKATPAYREMQVLADSAPVRDGRVILARPAAFLPELLMVLQEPVSGTPLDLLIGRMEGAATAGDPRGWNGVVGAAAALAAIHTAGLSAGRERPIAAEVKRFGKRAARIAEVDSELGAHMNGLAAALKPGLDRLPEWGAENTLVHGDCKPNQFLIGAEGVAILDFDHCGMSDPANDVGTFLATLRQLGIRQALKARGGAAAEARARWLLSLGDRFLDTYCAASGYGEEFRLRATWYQAAALMRKALRGFARAPRSPMPLAQVEEAWRVLATLPPP
jgi:aminoglycoside phosphotransferase (APT) family kinase protein